MAEAIAAGALIQQGRPLFFVEHWPAPAVEESEAVTIGATPLPAAKERLGATTLMLAHAGQVEFHLEQINQKDMPPDQVALHERQRDIHLTALALRYEVEGPPLAA